MAASPPAASTPAPDTAAYLDMPPERRVAAKAHAATLAASAARVANDLPLGADTDDFRRVLVTGTKSEVTS